MVRSVVSVQYAGLTIDVLLGVPQDSIAGLMWLARD